MPEPRPLVVLIGLPGAGKSRLAARLASALELPVVDRDAIRAAQFPAGRFSEAEKRAANAAVWAAVRAHAELGRGCILDGMTFALTAQRRRAAALGRRLGLRYLPVWLDCPVDLACERVRRNARHLAGDRSPALVRRVAERFQAPRRALRLDASGAPDALVRQTLIGLNLTGMAGRSKPPQEQKSQFPKSSERTAR